MQKLSGFLCLSAWALGILSCGVALRAQEPASQPGVVHVLGMEGVARNAKGALAVRGSALHFEQEKGRATIPLAAIADVFTGDDSQRVVRGTLQALSTFAPYGGGRFLSLFRTKVDVLTIEYRDAAGGLHGVVFTLPDGKALEIKKQLLAAGVRSSVPLEEEKGTEGKKP